MAKPTLYFDLVQYLSSAKYRSLRDILERFEVSERTAYRYLAQLNDLGVPLEKSDYGYRLFEGKTNRALRLNGTERALLRLALANPALRRDPTLRSTLRGLEDKLDALTRDAEETPTGLTLAGIDRTGPLPPGLIPALDHAVGAGTTLEILYASLTGHQHRWRAVDPWAVTHRSEAWYLVGRCHQHGEARTFRVDRIRETRPTGANFQRPLGFDVERYFADSWGIWRGSRKHKIVLRFPAALSAFILSAAHHKGEEKETLPDGRVEYRVTLTHLAEIRQWITGFGGQVEVVAPRELREGGGRGRRGGRVRE